MGVAKTNKHRWCAQCVGGLHKSEWPADWEPARATVYVSGRIWDTSDYRYRGYRGYLCDDHYTAFCDNGARLRVRNLSQERT